VASTKVPPHARAGQVGRGHRFAADPPCSTTCRVERVNGNELFATWRQFVLASRKDVVHVFWTRKLFRAIAVMFRGNPALSGVGGTHLRDWITELYTHQAAMLVRRELDRQSSVLNLRRLLHEIDDNFDVLVAHSESAELPTHEQVSAHLAQLESDCEHVRAFAERLVAHRTASPVQQPTVGEIDHALKAVAEAMRKYHNYVNATDLLSPTPTAGFDWLAPFRVAWLSPGWRELDDDEDLGA
jgi:hypothetical protein